MSTIVDQGVVVRQWDWSETSQTVSIFCRAHGMMRGIAKGSRREKGRFSGGLDPLTQGEVVAIIKPSAALATLTDWDLQEVFWSVRRDFTSHQAGLYLVDLTQRLIAEADPHPLLYEALIEALRAMEDRCDPSRCALAFQWAALAETGRQPDLTRANEMDEAKTLGFDAALGQVVSDPGAGPAHQGLWRVRTETIRLLLTLANSRDRIASLHDADLATVDRALRLLNTYIHWTLGRETPSAQPFFDQLDKVRRARSLRGDL